MAVEVQKIVQISGVNVGLSTVPFAGGDADLEGVTHRDPISGVGSSVTPDGTAGTNAACVHRLDGTAIAGDGVDGTGITPPTGASGIRGWLSGIYKLLGSVLAVEIQGTPTVAVAFPAVQAVESTTGVNALQAQTNGAVGAGAAAVAVKAGAGRLFGVTVTAQGSAPLTFTDGPSGTVLFTLAADAAIGKYADLPGGTPFSTSLYANSGANTPAVTVHYA